VSDNVKRVVNWAPGLREVARGRSALRHSQYLPASNMGLDGVEVDDKRLVEIDRPAEHAALIHGSQRHLRLAHHRQAESDNLHLARDQRM
jgi:hypothetical protein